MPKFDWNLEPALLKIGSWELRYYSLLFVLVFLGGYALLNWQIRRGGGDEEDAGDFIIYGVLGVLIGARLGHVLFYDLDQALDDPLWVFKIWTGGLASHGAVVGLATAMYLFTKRRGISYLEGCDRFAFSAALGASLVRLGNFFNSEIVGRATDQTWGVRFLRYDREPNIPYRHPSQLYEFVMGLAILGILYIADKKLGEEKRPRGAMISLFFVLYFFGRFLVEFVKEYQPGEAMRALTMGQILSLGPFLIGIYGLVWSFKRRIPVGWVSTFTDDTDDEDSEDDESESESEGEGEGATADTRAEHSDTKGTGGDPDIDEEFGSHHRGTNKA
ncbi:MAG: prolipoprotein diacylglyceryl transferase [Polyangiaceae bacterium]|nr:prolipoprotein diacylglyceryl transferase [Polyangiaceae bacterium]